MSRRRLCAIDLLESRVFLDASPVLLDPLTIPKYVQPLPNALDPSFVYQPSGTNGQTGAPHYDIGTYLLAQQDLGLGTDPITGQPRLTDVFAYGTSAATATYPGRTFVAQRNQPIEVTWSNHLPDQHILAIDPTLVPAEEGYDPATNTFAHGVPMISHLHGGHTETQSDGLPEQWFTRDDDSSGTPDLYGMDFQDMNLMQFGNGTTFTYSNDQDATTLWYHDHAMGITRLNAYAGLAGFYIVRDQYDTGAADNPLHLPSGQYEIPLVIQDKQFLANGQLYMETAPTLDADGNVVTETGILPEAFGNVIMVNGKAWPYQQVEARRYRFHILNGSDSRFYNLSFPAGSGAKMWIVGDDQGMLNSPVAATKLTIAPGERYDIVVDFTGLAGKTLTLRNDANAPYPGGDPITPGLTDQVMQFRVVAATSPDTSFVPTTTYKLRRGTTASDPELPITTPSVKNVSVRKLALFETTDEYGRIEPMLGTAAPVTVNGVTYSAGYKHFMDPITENPTLGSTEVWEIYNNTEDAHPIHIHLVKFQLVSRQGFTAAVDEATGEMSNITLTTAPIAPSAAEKAWQDTIIMYPGQVTRIVAKFDLPGKYVWHCHILSHEEHDMMRSFYVQPAPTGALPPSPLATNILLTVSTGPLTAPITGLSAPKPISLLLTSAKPGLLV